MDCVRVSMRSLLRYLFGSEGLLPRKCVVKVWLSKEQREILGELARRLGASESEIMRLAFMNYAKDLSLVKEQVHRTNSNRGEPV